VRLGLTVSGGEVLAANLRRLGDAVRRRALLGVLRAAAEPIRGRAAELAPLDPATPIDLKESMVISAATKIGSVAGGAWDAADPFQAAVAVGPARNIFYGIYQEYGTVRHSAQPFLRPAFDYGTDRSLAILRDGLWRLLEDANAGRGAFAPEEEATA